MLDAPAASRATGARGPRRASGASSQRREIGESFVRASSSAELGSGRLDPDRPRYAAPRRYSGIRLRLRGGVPRSVAGRVVTAAFLLGALGALTAALWGTQRWLLRDPRLTIPSSSSIQIAGNEHMSRPQLLSVFGEDVERNILTVPLAGRRQELESLPWVQHATVMRLLPDTIRVEITERTPVAFVRQGSHIGLVDASGVLLDLPPDPSHGNHYSFPVLTGISAGDPLSTRAARMKLFLKFTGDLDAGALGEDRPSKSLSEVDLSNPEDVKALIPSGSSDILVHFGEEDFLARYRRYEANLPGWRAQYPKLSSVDMRYERQVVLEMQAGTSVPVSDAGIVPAAPLLAKVARKQPAAALPAKLKAGVARPQGNGAVSRVNGGAQPETSVAQPKATSGAHPAVQHGHLETAFSVHAKTVEPTSRSHAAHAVPQ